MIKNDSIDVRKKGKLKLTMKESHFLTPMMFQYNSLSKTF